MVKLLSDVSEEPISCLISDAFFYFTQAVADSLRLPRVVLRTGGLSSFVVFVAFPLLRERGYLPIQDSQLEEPVAELPPLKVKDLPVMDNVDPDSFYEIIAGMVNESKASSGIIWNSFEELEQLEIERCIRRLMVEKEGEEIRDRISKLKDKAKFCLQQGGSSLQNLDSLVSHISGLESFVFQSQ
ncbi:udp-glycosyltransferase 76f1 [Quercus suber]|uniref:Udp-glycosyltransferase 76f1 n=1 Tax=Quercus suber TaxID=58331 RepID=A0AAW0JM79_QUESU